MIRMVLRGGRALSRKPSGNPEGNEHMQYIRLQIGRLPSSKKLEDRL